MGALEDVLARLINDPAFRDHLAGDPQAALSGYDLSEADLEVLAAAVHEGTGGEHGVERRTSKSALTGLLGAFAAEGQGEDASGLPTGKRRHQPFTTIKPPEGTDDAAAGRISKVDSFHMEQKVVGEYAPLDAEAGAPTFGDGEHGAIPDPGDSGDHHEDQIEILSWSPASSDAAGGDAIGSPVDDAGGVQHEESDLDFLHERPTGSEPDVAKGSVGTDQTELVGSDKSETILEDEIGTIEEPASPSGDDDGRVDLLTPVLHESGTDADPPSTVDDPPLVVGHIRTFAAPGSSEASLPPEGAPASGGSDPSAVPMEDVTLNYAEIKTEYTPQKDGGTTESPVGAYDVEEQEASSDEDGA